MRLVTIALSSLFLCCSALKSSSDTLIIPALAEAINNRLRQMKYVAAYKATRGIPVEDPEREHTVQLQAALTARHEGLTSCSVMDFVLTQMNISKAIQYRYMADFLFTNLQESPAESLAERRQKILNADTTILTLIRRQLAFGQNFSDQQKNELVSLLNEPNMNTMEKEHLVSAISRVKQAL